ncbi:class I SAM-dependent methyltransferase [Patescibacteria group bacterium]|nr:class I SAM-dependent methyltransferase [Patescibacteria group bacterium]
MPQKQPIPEYYRNEFEGRLGTYYDTLFALTTLGFQKRMRDHVISCLPKNPLTILDMACGTGSETILIKKHFPNAHVTGIDLSKTMLKKAQDKAHRQAPGITFSKEDIEHTSFAGNTFDAITVCFALHEMPPENILGTLKEMERLLLPNGSLIILELARPRFFFLKKGFDLYCALNEPFYKQFETLSLTDELQKESLTVTTHHFFYNGLIQLIQAKKNTPCSH